MNAPLLWYSLAPDPGQPLHPTALNDFGLTLGAAWGFNAYNPNAYTSAAAGADTKREAEPVRTRGVGVAEVRVG